MRAEPLTAAAQWNVFLTMVCKVGLSVASGFCSCCVQAVHSPCIVRLDSMTMDGYMLLYNLC